MDVERKGFCFYFNTSLELVNEMDNDERILKCGLKASNEYVYENKKPFCMTSMFYYSFCSFHQSVPLKQRKKNKNSTQIKKSEILRSL